MEPTTITSAKATTNTPACSNPVTPINDSSMTGPNTLRARPPATSKMLWARANMP